ARCSVIGGRRTSPTRSRSARANSTRTTARSSASPTRSSWTPTRRARPTSTSSPTGPSATRSSAIASTAAAASTRRFPAPTGGPPSPAYRSWPRPTSPHPANPRPGQSRSRMQDREIELRVATIPTANQNEDVVMRLLASSELIPLDKIDLTPRNLREIKKIAEKPYGLILCVGPTGSGKTTTLHSLLGHINKPDRKIWTAEDPVEITQYGLRQVQVMPKIGFDFAAAMRAFLRADPDVIMVGEMRDEETASTGIEASLTGHLVFSTLHTNSAVETVIRL